MKDVDSASGEIQLSVELHDDGGGVLSPGEQRGLNVIVHNIGQRSVKNLQVTGRIPDGVMPIAASAPQRGGKCSVNLSVLQGLPESVGCYGATLEPGEQYAMYVVYRIDEYGTKCKDRKGEWPFSFKVTADGVGVIESSTFNFHENCPN